MALTNKLTAIANAIRSKTGDSGTMTLDEMPTKIDSISGSEQLAVFSQVNPLVTSYMANVTYDSSDYTTSSVLSYSYTETDYDKGKPSGYSVSLKDAGEIRLSDDVSSIEDVSPIGSYTLYNAKPNYAANWCNIVAENIKQSGTIKPTGQVRMINTTASNVRDLGGWTCDGGTIKYGKIFRGGELSADDKHVLVEQLRIKHDIDLRGTVDNNNGGATSSPLGDSVKYTPTEKYVWYSINSNAEEWKLILGTIFNAVKTDEPVIFHCAAGADRTGTVACVVEALLGVAQNDIDKDFELTSFAIHPNARRRTDDNWKALISEIDAFVVGDTFRDKVVNFVGTLGFTSDDINAFRHSMIDGTPADIVVVEPPQGRLPKEYQEVEWIGGSADANYTFCIKPDLTWNNFDKIEFAGFRDNYDGYSGSNGIMLLATWTSASARTSPYVSFRDSKNGLYCSGVTGTIDNNFMQTQLRESDFKTFTVTFTSHSNSGQVEFGSWSDASFGSCWQTKEQKWYSGTELVRHLVPCYRSADDVIGMYDLVTSAFFDNSGGGVFIKGSNVQAN